MILVREYLDEASRSPFAIWFVSLDTRAALKVTTALERIALGHTSAMKSVGHSVSEYRIHYGPHSMPLTRDFRKTILERAKSDPEFRQGLLLESMELINTGDFATGRAILRNYINATIGFQQIAEAVNIPSASLQRMFGPTGNPRAQNLSGILAYLQRQEGIQVELQARQIETAVA